MLKSLFMLAGIFGTLNVTAQASTSSFHLASTSFLDQNKCPTLYTCDGKDISPELHWTNMPPKTKSLALILSDPDAPGGTFYHWVIYNIPTTAISLPEGTKEFPAGSITGKNSWGREQYNGPCPPRGALHHYIFTLYALDNELNLSKGANASTVINAMQNHIINKAVLTAVYSH